MMPILAVILSFVAFTLNAQQTLPLPPRMIAEPLLVDSIAIPEQSAEELQSLAAVAPEEPAAPEDSSIKLSPTKRVEAKGNVILSEGDELARLESIPVFNLQTNKAPLTDVLTLLADACQMSYVGLEKGVGENVQISVSINKNPYAILEHLCKRYNVALSYEDGVWHFGIYNDAELIARIYRIRYNDKAEFSGGDSSGGGEGGQATGSSSGSSSSSSSGSGESGSSNVSSSANNDKTVKNETLTKDIETFLGFSSQNPNILTAPDFNVDDMTEIMTRGILRVLPTASGESATPTSGKVIYDGDSQNLYVLATRAQHQWIEKYLAAIDKPQRQILVETKIYETSMKPERALGANLERFSMGSGTLRLASSPGLPDGSSSAILTAKELTATLNLLDTDTTSTSVQYPRQITVSNRAVGIASTMREPIQKSSSTTDTGSSTGTSSEIEDVTTGTNISILPRIIDNNKVQMDISVTVSEISGYKTIVDSSGSANQYPIVVERDYKTQAIVETGYTLAIGGLKKSSTTNTYAGVPVLSKVPVVGALFRNTDRKKTDSNLMIFISPTILTEYRGGVTEEPQFILPRDKDYPQRRVFQGSPEETYTDIMLALGGFERQTRELAQRGKEYEDPSRLRNSIDSLENELKLMRVRLEEIALEQPQKDISAASSQITQNLKDLDELRRSIAKRNSILR